MDYYGRVEDIFIPGCRDQHGRTSDHMEAPFLAFILKIFVCKNKLSVETLDLPKELLIIERDTWESASIIVGDWVKIPVAVIKGYDDWDGYNKVFLNLSNSLCVTKTTCPPKVLLEICSYLPYI